jgi:hypothetical protein
MIKFYKKLDPAVQPVMSNNQHLDFKTLDHLVGYFATDSQFVQDELALMMSQHRFGLTEITQEEFHADYVQKKTMSQPLKPLWREEMGKVLTGTTPLSQLGAEKVQAVVAAKGSDVPARPIDAAAEQAAMQQQQRAEQQQPSHIPKVGQRKRSARSANPVKPPT